MKKVTKISLFLIYCHLLLPMQKVDLPYEKFTIYYLFYNIGGCLQSS